MFKNLFSKDKKKRDMDLGELGLATSPIVLGLTSRNLSKAILKPMHSKANSYILDQKADTNLTDTFIKNVYKTNPQVKLKNTLLLGRDKETNAANRLVIRVMKLLKLKPGIEGFDAKGVKEISDNLTEDIRKLTSRGPFSLRFSGTNSGILYLPKKYTTEGIAAHEFGHYLRGNPLAYLPGPTRYAGIGALGLGTLLRKRDDDKFSTTQKTGLGLIGAGSVIGMGEEIAANARAAKLLKQFGSGPSIKEFSMLRRANLKSHGAGNIKGLAPILGIALGLKGYYHYKDKNRKKMQSGINGGA